jgi:ABC-type antimicrobial peptide transport system permease subunit
VVSYFVNLRTKEIGVRMALGASTRSVLTLMTRQALLPVALGLVLGAAGALAATRLLRASLFDVTPADPLTFALVLSGLLGVALVAIVIPARRASRVEPTEALQS